MTLVIPFQQITESDAGRIGGKAHALATMMNHGMSVPQGVCVTTDAYREYLSVTGLGTEIVSALNRKNLDEMRWEEIWDTALKIRNLFSKTPLPPGLGELLKEGLKNCCRTTAVAVRSSAPGEDGAATSFAGLHASFINIHGLEAILNHIRRVWASLWSDAALLYRRELGLNVEQSAMAVVVQETVAGEKSGVAFGVNPSDPEQAVIEAAYGLNQGLVDGLVEPDRWILDRETGHILSHRGAVRTHTVVTSERGLRQTRLPKHLQGIPPLSPDEVNAVFRQVTEAEALFSSPQDVEWTWKDGRLHLLQARPITTMPPEKKDDRRTWYMSLRRSFENLQHLRSRIEKEHIPSMVAEASRLGRLDLTDLSDLQLVEEHNRRRKIFEKWHGIYWTDFIPFAHGMRLFAMSYNDAVQPSNAYEFIALLAPGDMESLQRNRLLEAMAVEVRESPGLAQNLEEGKISHAPFKELLDTFMEQYGDLFAGTAVNEGMEPVIQLILEMAAATPKAKNHKRRDVAGLEAAYLDRFEEEEREKAAALLELGRASYRLRDDDNVYMGKIKGQLLRVQEEMARRNLDLGPDLHHHETADRFNALKDPGAISKPRPEPVRETPFYEMRARQIVGDPAGPGLASGPARVIDRASDLMAFKAGEVLVCDAVDPNMTFVVPLAAGIVERRGGMLIHGAIIAREYGVPCVTGVAGATEVIRTGEPVTVDGYLGIVVIG